MITVYYKNLQTNLAKYFPHPTYPLALSDLIDLLDGGALLCHHLRFARIRRQHAIAHEAIA